MKIKIVVIGASTGGPNALGLLFTMFPKDFPTPIIIAQHLGRQFTKSLANQLNGISAIPVSEIANNDAIEPGQAYLIPGDCHFFLYHSSKLQSKSDGGSYISLIPADDLPMPSISMGLTSVAEHYGPGTLGIILSGMGSDGVVGARAVKQVGGHIFAQDESTSAIYSMPRAVKDAGFVDKVLPLNLIVPHLLKFIK